MENEEKQLMNDHDLLVTLHEQVIGVRHDIKELREGTSFRIISLEKEKADRRDVEVIQKIVNEDMEQRMRVLEKGHAGIEAKASQMSVWIAYVISIGGLLIEMFLRK